MTNIQLIFALGFANLPLLYGLAAASVPILIHLLNRRKFREVPWAAMRFLLAAIRKNQRRIRIEQWLLAGGADADHPAGRRGDGQAVPRVAGARSSRAAGSTGCSCSTRR